MSAVRPSVVCDRVRAQVSLQLDGELSQLERRMLASHLARCPECDAYASDVADFTEKLRNAPRELPERPIVVRRPRRSATARLQVGAAAAIAVAALGIGGQLAVPGSSSELSQLGSVTRFPTAAELERELAIIDNVNAPQVSPRAGIL